MKKIIEYEIKPSKIWLKIIDKYILITDKLLTNYNRKNNILCTNNLTPNNILLDSDKNIIISELDHLGINQIFYELSNYFNNLDKYPDSESREKYYNLLFKKGDNKPEKIEYIDKNILLYSSVSNLYWALWALIQFHENKIHNKYFNDMYNNKIKKFLE